MYSGGRRRLQNLKLLLRMLMLMGMERFIDNFLFHNAIVLKVDISDYVAILKRRGIYTTIKQVEDIFAIADRLSSY
jgi:hypothetical protein